MGRQKATWSPEDVARLRQQLDSKAAVKALNEQVTGQTELSRSRLKAIEICLRKTLPDTSSVELTGGGGAPLVFTWKPADDE